MLLIGLGLMLSIPITPMLVNMRDSRDRAGGIAGGIIIALLIGAGGLCAFRHYLPSTMIRLVRIGFGLLSILFGVVLIAWVAYNLLIERQPEFKMYSIGQLGIPVIMVIVGYKMVTRGHETPDPANDK